MNLYEFIGYHLGDGYILYNPSKNQYNLEITGNANEQKEYFKKLARFIECKIGKTPKIFVKKEKLGQSLKLKISHKEFISYLVLELNICHKDKSFNADIPENLLSWQYSKHIIRGFFEADGSLFFSKSKNGPFPTYPRIEMKTSSKKLSNQICYLLKRKDFKVNTTSSKYDKTLRIYLSGEKMLCKWVAEIGFSDPKTISKYQFWKNFGFYIPKISYKTRKLINAEVAKRPKMFKEIT